MVASRRSLFLTGHGQEAAVLCHVDLLTALLLWIHNMAADPKEQVIPKSKEKVMIPFIT